MGNGLLKVDRGGVLVVLSSFFYATYGIWSKMVGDQTLDGFTVISLRSVFSLLLLFVLFPKARSMKFDFAQNWPYILAMVFTSIFIWGPLFYAFNKGEVGYISTVNYAGLIVGMVLFGVILCDEKISVRKFISLAIGILGVFIIAGGVQANKSILLITCITGIASAAKIILASKLNYPSAIQRSMVFWIVNLVANLPFSLYQNNWGLASPKQLLFILLWAAFGTTAGYLLIRALEIVKPGKAGILGLTEIIFSIILGLVVFREKITWNLAVGAVVILIAAILIETKYTPRWLKFKSKDRIAVASESN